MARIRSIHPGIWTDEDFVEMSTAARLFLIGMWNEADDYGVLEWRPTKLKMRLAPADAIDAGETMDEIARAGFIVRVERAGKVYAVVKNFRKWQRPKHPSAPLIPVDEEIARIVNLPDDGRPTPALPQPSPNPTGIPPQMEDGGGKRDTEEPVGSSDAPRVASPSVALTPSQRVWQDYPHQLAAMAGKPEGPIRKWMGKALKAAPPEAFAAAADAALRAGTKDPCAYITAALKNTTGPPARRGRDGYAEILDMLEANDEPTHDYDDGLRFTGPADCDPYRPAVERAGNGPGRVLDLAPIRTERRRA